MKVKVKIGIILFVVVVSVIIATIIVSRMSDSDEKTATELIQTKVISGSQESWPMFRGGQQLLGRASGTLSDSLKFLWKFKTSDQVKSSPAIEDNIVWGVLNKYEIFVNNPEGKLLKKIIREYDGIVINKEEEDKLIKAWFGNNPVPPQMTIKFPKVYPPFFRFTCDEEGRIFAQTYEKTEDEEEYYYDVFDSEGRYIVRISLKYRPQVWKNKKLYMIEENEEGFQVVKRYKVHWDL